MTRHPPTGQALAAEEPGSSSTRTQPYLNVPQDDDHDEHAIESGSQRLELEHETTIDSYKTARSSRPFADGFRSVRDKFRGGFGSGSGSSRVLPRFGFEGGVGARDFLVWDGRAKYIVMSFLWFSEVSRLRPFTRVLLLLSPSFLRCRLTYVLGVRLAKIATCIIGLVLPPGPTCNDGTFRNRKPPLIIAYMIMMIVCSALALPFSLYLSFIPR